MEGGMEDKEEDAIIDQNENMIYNSNFDNSTTTTLTKMKTGFKQTRRNQKMVASRAFCPQANLGNGERE